MPRLWSWVGRELVFVGRFLFCLLLLAVALAAIGISQDFINFSDNCSEESPVAPYWFCVETGPPLKTYLANDTVYQQGGGGGSTPTPSLEETRAVDPDITGATTLANAVKICRTGTTTCDDAVRIALYCDVGNICRMEFYNAANALVTEAKAVYAASSWLISIDTAGTQTTCLTMDDTGLMTYAALESCGRLSGLVHLEFSEDDGTHPCNAGNFGIWADVSLNKLRACQNGGETDLVGSAGPGAGDIEAVGDCATGACFGTVPATHAFMGGTPAAFRALADADIPDALTASNYLPLAGGTMTGAVLYSGSGKPLKSVGLPAAGWNVQGAAALVLDTALVSGGLLQNFLRVTSSNSDGFHTALQMPDSWDGGTLLVRVYAICARAACAGDLAMHFSAACVQDSGAWATTISTTGEQLVTVTFDTQNDLELAITGALTPNGTCTAPALLRLQGQIHVPGTTLDTNELLETGILSMRLEYAVSSASD